MRIVQGPGFVAVSYELIHDTRLIPLDPSPRETSPADSGVFEYACHEGNYGLSYMLSTSRLQDR